MLSHVSSSNTQQQKRIFLWHVFCAVVVANVAKMPFVCCMISFRFHVFNVCRSEFSCAVAMCTCVCVCRSSVICVLCIVEQKEKNCKHVRAVVSHRNAAQAFHHERKSLKLQCTEEYV